MWKKKGKHNFRLHYATLRVSGNNSPIVSVLTLFLYSFCIDIDSVLTVSISSGLLFLSILYLRKLRKLKYIQRIAIRMIRNQLWYFEKSDYDYWQNCAERMISSYSSNIWKDMAEKKTKSCPPFLRKPDNGIMNLSYRKVESDWKLGTKS